MNKPIKPVRKYKRLTSVDRPREPSKIKTITAYRIPSLIDQECDFKWDTLSDTEKRDVLSDYDLDIGHDEIDLDFCKEENYCPGDTGPFFSLKDLMENVPEELWKESPEKIMIVTDINYYYEEGREELNVYYNVPNEDYEVEMREFCHACDQFEKNRAAWKEENIIHKERLAKYKIDMKSYNQWRANRIKELEAAGEL